MYANGFVGLDSCDGADRIIGSRSLWRGVVAGYILTEEGALCRASVFLVFLV